MHVAVIGAGAAGLCAARHLSAPRSGFTCVVYEQTDTVGGTWVYTEHTGKDKYGLPICSAMYKNLRTNLGKENMEFPGFPFVNSKSFITAGEVLQYLEDYADHYCLKKHIKFLHHVKTVTPKDQKWEITVVDLPNNQRSTEEFDAVVICNGHYSTPYMGHFPGISEFEGEVKHSHTYRTPEPFTDKTVLVCGGGPSGVDISYDLANFASKVYFSHKSDLKPDTFPMNVQQVPVVKVVKSDHVVFEDGTTSGYIDIILICTGYHYNFPFLAPECGITVESGKFIQPLYKHIVNVHRPTMGFIGLLFRSFLFPLFDYQVRFFLKTLSGEVALGSQDDMLAELAQEVRQKHEQGVPVRKYHEIGDNMRPYLEELGEIAQLGDLPPVVYNIYNLTVGLRKHYLSNYRDAVFEIVNEKDFRLSGLKVDEQKLGIELPTCAS